MAPASSAELLRRLLLLVFVIALVSPSVLSQQQSCGLNTIVVSQRTTGARRGLDMEFEVVVRNGCGCAQKDVRVYARGFMSQRVVDPAVFRPDAGGTFLVNGGNPISPGSSVRFTYWWDHATYFTSAGSQALCP